MKQNLVLAVIMLLALCTAGVAQEFKIIPGTATVDGMVSPGEWDDANWIHMDKLYWSPTGTLPTDLTNAWWAAKWDGGENVIYVVITGTDTDHVMHAYTVWDGQDAIELYINARHDHTENYYQRQHDYAQQYVAGYDTNTAAAWVVLGGGDVVPSNTLPEMAISVVTNEVTYEFKLRPYDLYVYTNVAESTEIDLQAGLIVGLDVVMNSRTATGQFAMLCANQVGGKFWNAGAMQDHTLLGLPGMWFIVR